MQEVIAKTRKRLKLAVDSRVIVAAIGLLLSVVLHELFHIFMHVGHITSIGFFTTPGTILEIHSIVPARWDLELEEVIAYTITVLTMLVTIMIVWHIHDRKDTRSYYQILLPATPVAQQ